MRKEEIILKIYSNDECGACYFRTAADYPSKKSLLQVTERCNLHCSHCFVSSGCYGNDMDLNLIRNHILPEFIKHNITKVTITGGEPFVYPDLLEVVKMLRDNKISVCICTNASLVTSDFIKAIKPLNGIHFNVSLDGFSNSSHGKFRGNESKELFNQILYNIKMLGKDDLLNGILVTPNIYANIEEYVEICNFAKNNHAKYVLFNPLSEFGRGEQSVSLSYSKSKMNDLRKLIEPLSDVQFETVFIRFPNGKRLPLNKCPAGKIIYIFTNGDVAFCPYMVFAAKNSSSIYNYKDFIMGNIFEKKFSWEANIDHFHPPMSYDEVCINCGNVKCRKGCYAAKIALGVSLESSDEQLCPLSENMKFEK